MFVCLNHFHASHGGGVCWCRTCPHTWPTRHLCLYVPPRLHDWCYVSWRQSHDTTRRASALASHHPSRRRHNRKAPPPPFPAALFCSSSPPPAAGQDPIDLVEAPLVPCRARRCADAPRLLWRRGEDPQVLDRARERVRRARQAQAQGQTSQAPRQHHEGPRRRRRGRRGCGREPHRDPACAAARGRTGAADLRLQAGSAGRDRLRRGVERQRRRVARAAHAARGGRDGRGQASRGSFVREAARRFGIGDWGLGIGVGGGAAARAAPPPTGRACCLSSNLAREPPGRARGDARRAPAIEECEKAQERMPRRARRRT